MKKIIFISALTILFFTSCEKVINIDLNDSESEVMIEAIITDDSSNPQIVKLSKSVNFDQSNNVIGIAGATVSISDESGNTFLLSESSTGNYETNSFVGEEGKTYYLMITVDGNTYTSTCKMPQKVNFQSIDLQSTIFPGEEDPVNIVIPRFNDPQGKGNYYRFKIKNFTTGKNSTLFMLINDEIVDGTPNDMPIIDQDLKIKSGDSISVEMMCIDKNVYNYFFSLSQNGSGPNASATPANPVTNIVGGKLGYFSAHTTQTINVIVP